jgi:hypothetical protein
MSLATHVSSGTRASVRRRSGFVQVGQRSLICRGMILGWREELIRASPDQNLEAPACPFYENCHLKHIFAALKA